MNVHVRQQGKLKRVGSRRMQDVAHSDPKSANNCKKHINNDDDDVLHFWAWEAEEPLPQHCEVPGKRKCSRRQAQERVEEEVWPVEWHPTCLPYM